MKQELIEKIKQNQIKDRIESEYTGGINEGIRIAISCVEKAFEQSKEIVPQFVADWFEKNKNDLDFAIYEAVAHSIKEVGYKHYPDGFMEWIVQSTNNPFDTLIRMKNGYEVEEDKLYKVIIDNKYLVQLFIGRTDARLVEFEELTILSESAYKLTEETIKAIDERYWAFAVPVEVNES